MLTINTEMQVKQYQYPVLWQQVVDSLLIDSVSIDNEYDYENEILPLT